tara:strand:+ start:199 stop:858 length:660 start_codon:yes stop_codon:yes gene_type:complete
MSRAIAILLFVLLSSCSITNGALASPGSLPSYLYDSISIARNHHTHDDISFYHLHYRYGEASSGLLRRTFALHRQIPLEQARFTGLPSKPDGDCREEKGVLVECPEKSFVVWHDSQVDRDNWLADLDKCVSVLRERSAVEMGTVAPLWAPDGEHLDCMLCFEPFSLVFRRHHCRRCGRVVCDSCSKHRAFLSNIDASKAVRICSECNGVLHKKRKSLTL